MTALGDVVPDQDVAIQAVGIAMGLLAGVGDPVVVVGGAHLVRDSRLSAASRCPMMKMRGIFLQDHGLALLARQVGIHVEKFFGVKEREFFRQVGIAGILQFGEHFLRELLGADEDFPDLADNRLSGIPDCAARR